MTTGLNLSFFEFFDFWIWTNHNYLLGIETNQFASFCIDIRSLQCYFRVCPSGEIWNKKAYFLCILFFFYLKQIDPMLPCVCSVIDHRGCQNVVRASVTHSAAPRMSPFWFLPHFEVICDLLLLNRRMATWNLFVKWCIIVKILNPVWLLIILLL